MNRKRRLVIVFYGIILFLMLTLFVPHNIIIIQSGKQDTIIAKQTMPIFGSPELRYDTKWKTHTAQKFVEGTLGLVDYEVENNIIAEIDYEKLILQVLAITLPTVILLLLLGEKN